MAAADTIPTTTTPPPPPPPPVGQEGAEDEEVFEIREWIDEAGQEVSSEVVSVKEAAQEVAKLDLVGALERATAAAAAASEEEPPAAVPSEAQRRLLDAHDWEGIKARADELERLEAKARSGALDAEADARVGRDKLEGQGWAKGFLNNGGGGGGSGGGGGGGGGGSSKKRGSSNEAAKAQQQQQQQQATAATTATTTATAVAAEAPATRTAATKSALSSPEKKAAADRPRKHVSFQLDAAPSETAREPGPLDDYHCLLQHHKQLRASRGWGGSENGGEEEKEEAKRGPVQPQPQPPQQQPPRRRGPVAFSGEVGERAAAPTATATATAAASIPSAEAAPAATAVGAAVMPPGMSRFKARALGLLPPESN